MQKIAIYDMDRTITVRGTYTPFLFFMVFARAPWRVLLLPLLPFGFIGYALKLISRKSLKTYNQRLMLGSRPRLSNLAPHIATYAEKVLSKNIYPRALEQVAKDRAEGRMLILATASYELYVNDIAARLGFDHVIATRLEVDSTGCVLPKIIGENCYDEAKLDRIKEFLAAQNLERADVHIRAYSDHVSDAPMLEYADDAVATTPSTPLRHMAKQRDWKIVDWND